MPAAVLSGDVGDDGHVDGYDKDDEDGNFELIRRDTMENRHEHEHEDVQECSDDEDNQDGHDGEESLSLSMGKCGWPSP